MATTNLTNRLKTPGVYIEEIVSLPPSITQVETAIPVFVGFTETIPLIRGKSYRMEPLRITSMLEYKLHYGEAAVEVGIVVDIKTKPKAEINGFIDPEKGPSKYKMHYALELFFANGGGPCWIVSTGTYEETQGVIRPDLLNSGLAATAKIDEITLYVFPDAQGIEDEFEFYGLYKAAIDLCVDLQDRFTVVDLWPVPGATQLMEDINLMRDTLTLTVTQAKYAAAYFPNLDTTIDLYCGEDTMRDNVVSVKLDGQDMKLGDLKGVNNAMYFRAVNAINSIACPMPPSPAMVGIYASVDAGRGVWKAPANVPVDLVSDLRYRVTDAEQGGINVDVVAGKSVNVIRKFTGRGILVWGARTLAGNDNEWRYISVRRFFNMVEESTKNATQQFVFEPNDRNTWTRVRSMIENFLTLQWKAGALMGATTADAFYVRVGLGETMTGLDVLEGRMIVEIGMAVVRPAEFIILQFIQMMPASD